MITLIKTINEADEFICNEVCNDSNSNSKLTYLEYVKELINKMQPYQTLTLAAYYTPKNEEFFYKCLSCIIICYPEIKLKLSDDLKFLKIEH